MSVLYFESNIGIFEYYSITKIYPIITGTRNVRSLLVLVKESLLWQGREFMEGIGTNTILLFIGTASYRVKSFTTEWPYLYKTTNSAIIAKPELATIPAILLLLFFPSVIT